MFKKIFLYISLTILLAVGLLSMVDVYYQGFVLVILSFVPLFLLSFFLIRSFILKKPKRELLYIANFCLIIYSIIHLTVGIHDSIWQLIFGFIIYVIGFIFFICSFIFRNKRAFYRKLTFISFICWYVIFEIMIILSFFN